MSPVRCVVPVTVRLAGRTGPNELLALEDAVAGLVARRLQEARGQLAARMPELDLAPEPLRGPWIDTRFDAAASAYAVPSYEGGGKPTPVAVQKKAAPAKVEGSVLRVEVYLAEELVLAVRDGSRAPLVFKLLSTGLPVGTNFHWAFQSGGHVLDTGAKGQILIRFRGLKEDLEAFSTLLTRLTPAPGATVGMVPAQVFESAIQGASRNAGGAAGGTGPAPTATVPTGTSPTGEPVTPLAEDLSVLEKDAALAALFLDFLARFGGVSAAKSEASSGLAKAKVEALVKGKPRALTVVRFFTQGWNEWKKAGGSGTDGFAVLEEALLTQWLRGNATVLRNQLEIDKDRQGFGLFLRNTPIKLYDEFGMPLPAVAGGYKDSGFRASEPPSFALNIQIEDRGLFQVLRAIQQTTVDDSVLVYKAAKAYVDNGDLVWPALREGWNAWSAIEKELQRQMPILVLFLAGHTVALVLKRNGSPQAVAIGVAIEGVLWAAGRALQIVFIGQLLYMAYRAGSELSLVKRPEPGQSLDALSQRHLDNAIAILRELITVAVAAGLTAATVKLAQSIVAVIPPPGGGGGLQPAAATVGGRGPVPAPKAGAVEGLGPPPKLPALPITPSAMASVKQGDKEPALPSGQESQSGVTGGKKVATGGKGDPAAAVKSSATNVAPEKPKTGAQLEKEELKFHQQTRPARGPTYFDAKKARFSKLLSDLKAYIAAEQAAGRPDPIGQLNESALKGDTHSFIDGNPRLARFWRARSQALAQRLDTVSRELLKLPKKDGGRRRLELEKTELEAAIEEMNAFEKGDIANKELDLIEVFPGEKRVIITDITQKPFDPFHNFKTEFYVEVVKALFGWTEVYGVEFRDVRSQQVVP
ncbi:MAG: hypothetical protein U0002_04785 [Thermoanaerobaculia bacterium]